MLAEGETIVGHAACEPHIQDLCHFLVSLGAQIEGIGSNIVRITGVARAPRRRAPDPAGARRGRELRRARRHDRRRRDDRGRRARRPDLDRARRSASSGSRSRWGRRPFASRRGRSCTSWTTSATRSRRSRAASGPRFPADLTSIAVVAATQARGTVLVFEKMFESRLFFVDKLVSMGARIILCDPHRVVVTGPARLYGQRLESPDIRAGMAMVIAALCAEGESSIGNIGQIDRGYERIDERLRALGAIDRADGAVSGARLSDGTGTANVATGVPVLDHLLVELAACRPVRSRARDRPGRSRGGGRRRRHRARPRRRAAPRARRARRGDDAGGRGARDGRRRARQTGRSSPRTPT